MSTRHYSTRTKRLRPTGHSATIEALIQPAIVVGSTLMSAIAAYVLALDEITRILARQGQPADVFVVGLCAGMGFLVDMAIIVSATRYKMHAIRADPREARWLQLAKWVLVIGLTSESMTLFYFFTHLDPSAFPAALIWLASIIHAALAISRAFLPPVVIAYFAAGVLPVMFDRADRNREIKSRTSSNIMLLIDRLSEVLDTDDKAEMLRALGGQLMLDTYATYDETARTTEDEQLRRDAKLLAHLARIHRLDWSAIAADVAPELATDPVPEGKRKEEEQPQPAPQQPQPIPMRPQPRNPPNTERRPATGAEEEEPAPALTPAARTDARPRQAAPLRRAARPLAQSLRAQRDGREGVVRPERQDLRTRREEAARRVLIEQPDVTNTRLAQLIAIATKARISESTARAIREQVQEQLTPQIARPALHIITPDVGPDAGDAGADTRREN